MKRVYILDEVSAITLCRDAMKTLHFCENARRSMRLRKQISDLLFFIWFNGWGLNRVEDTNISFATVDGPGVVE